MGIRHILVVCPYLSILDASEKALEAAGYAVSCAHNTTAAMRQLFTSAVDLVVLCSTLSASQRQVMLEQIRERWHLPVVFLSPGNPDAVEQLLNTLIENHAKEEAA